MHMLSGDVIACVMRLRNVCEIWTLLSNERKAELVGGGGGGCKVFVGGGAHSGQNK